MSDELVSPIAREICAERNADDCRLGCTAETGCLQIEFDESDAEYRFAQAALGAIKEAGCVIVPADHIEAQAAEIEELKALLSELLENAYLDGDLATRIHAVLTR